MRYGDVEDAQIIDGTVTARQDAAQTDPFVAATQAAQQSFDPQQAAQQAQAYGPDSSNYYDSGGYVDPTTGVDVTGIVDAGVGMAMNPRSRNIALFVKVPLLAYVALHEDLPGLVRLTAAVLGVMEALEAADRAPQVLPLIDGSGY